jgi:hypothetical protein
MVPGSELPGFMGFASGWLDQGRLGRAWLDGEGEAGVWAGVPVEPG